MKFRLARSIRAALLPVAAALLALSGCSPFKYTGVLPLNQRPVVELNQAPASTTQPYFYAYEMRWAGFDMDGTIDHFLYCVDPPTTAGADTPWVATTANRQTFTFRSQNADSAGSNTASAYHTFVLKAVDDGGLLSAPVARSFNSFTLAPTVTILAPVPNHLNTPTLAPAFRVTWTGTDPDGRAHPKPVKYKWKVFPENGLEFDFLTVLVNPDSLRRYYAPNFSAWDSVGGDTTSVDISQLEPNKRYVFIVIAFDEAGAYSPVLNFDSSMLYFVVSNAAALGPRMIVFNDSFYYDYGAGSFSLDENTFLKIEVAADRPLRFNWTGRTTSGSYVAGYRWRIDGDLGDEAPRSDQNTDIWHWSHWSPGTTLCDLPPFSPRAGTFSETHYLYVEAKDNQDQMSLVVVRFTAVRPTFQKNLLFVDDTRLTPDKLTTTTPRITATPTGLWPMAAELDTFFFARGGNQWKDYPAGKLSPPGVFNGYAFDTVATKFIPGGLLSLGQLGAYRHIVWYTDIKSALFINPVDYAISPMPALHAMSTPGLTNPLTVWLGQGGKLWMFGGGTAYSMQIDWEKVGTNGSIYSATDGELAPGRLMYDGVHWRSEVTVSTSVQATRAGSNPRAWPGAPSFDRLPPYLFEKTAATDPMATYAPTRTNLADFFQRSYSAEGITKANSVGEDADPDPNIVVTEPTLDTLYFSIGGSLGVSRPIMTLYHGSETGSVVYCGFPLWYFRREQVISLADFVLHDWWGLPRNDVPR